MDGNYKHLLREISQRTVRSAGAFSLGANKWSQTRNRGQDQVGPCAHLQEDCIHLSQCHLSPSQSLPVPFSSTPPIPSLPVPPADPSVSPLSPSAPQRVHLPGALELPARPRPPALLHDGFLPCQDPAEVVPGPGWWPLTWSPRAIGPTSCWCCWRSTPSLGSPPAARWSTSAWSTPETALGYGGGTEGL